MVTPLCLTHTVGAWFAVAAGLDIIAHIVRAVETQIPAH